LGEGRGNAFIMFLKGRRNGDCRNAKNSGKDSGTSEETILEGQTGLGLFKVPITSPWTQTVKASGGR